MKHKHKNYTFDFWNLKYESKYNRFIFFMHIIKYN